MHSTAAWSAAVSPVIALPPSQHMLLLCSRPHASDSSLSHHAVLLWKMSLCVSVCVCVCVCVCCTRVGKHACIGLLQAAANCSSGVVDEQQQCCASGLLDNSITCCDEGSALDGAGWCCPGGVVDACGLCNGTGTAVDVEGTCCNSTIDATGVCCQVRVTATPLSGPLS